MSVLSVLQRTFIVSPLVLMGSICAESRFHADTFQPLTCTIQQEENISAYIEPVRAVELLKTKTQSPAELRTVAKMWIDGAASGKLRALVPSSSDDSLRSPIKCQICAANNTLISKLYE